MKIDLFYMLNLNNITRAKRTYLKNNINSHSTVPKKAYQHEHTIDLGDINGNVRSNSVRNKIKENITKNNMKPLEKGDVVVDKTDNQPYILTDYNFKPVSWHIN